MRRRPSGRGGLIALASFDGKGRMNSVERLVHMAFWDPRMKAMILANREGLSDVAAQAIARLD
jgi:hypothetical protein